MSSPLALIKAELFKALSHPIRIQILDALREKEYNVNELKNLLGLEAANVSQQLAILRSKKVVKTRKEANNVYYSVQDEAVFSLLDVAKTIFKNQYSGMKHCLSEGLQMMIPLVTVAVLELLSPFYLALEAGLLEAELLFC
jgi:DNA-binding transcriptional ArsR family regulator